MEITPENLIRHELIGLTCKVIKSNDPSFTGVKGLIVDETKNMLVLEVKGKRMKISKSIATFQLYLKDKKVLVEGKCLVSRPEDRIKK